MCIPLAYSFCAYAAHWWTDTDVALANALAEMPVGYSDKMVPVNANLAKMLVDDYRKGRNPFKD